MNKTVQGGILELQGAENLKIVSIHDMEQGATWSEDAANVCGERKIASVPGVVLDVVVGGDLEALTKVASPHQQFFSAGITQADYHHQHPQYLKRSQLQNHGALSTICPKRPR
ncbi:hypothetical protein BGW39_005727 [Mortierella sp. 14UC]|nr:hypothetical protein BGW39_005727 [Mortierella sp. 14UC]